MSQFKFVLIGLRGGRGKLNWDNVLKSASFFFLTSSLRQVNTPVDEKGGGVGRVGEHVEESQDEEGEDVLNVILVSPPHSLNILVDTLSSLTEQNLSKRCITC